MIDAELDQCRHDGALLRSIVSRQVQLKREGNHWKGCCPFHDDKTPSFAVYDDGFCCFACGVKGSIFDYIMRRDRVEFPRAVEIVAAERGHSTTKPKTKGRDHHSASWQAIMPVPQEAPRPPDQQLVCDALHEYRDAEDRLLFYVRRYEAKDGNRKAFKPLTYGVRNGGRGWHDKAPDAPRPLYRLNALSHAESDAPVLLVEGEKAADSAHRLFPDYVTMTWSGGANADGNSDFSPLLNRDVILWPDADVPGRKAMTRIAKQLPQARIIDTTGLPDGYDAADLETGDCENPAAWLQARLCDCSDLDDDDTADEPPPGEDRFDLRKCMAIEAWVERPMPPPDRLLGDLLTTTSRLFLVSRTGLGKTMLGFAMACGIASGSGFLHWRSGRPARVLYIDGEMPADLIKSRSLDALRRTDKPLPAGNLLIYARDTEEEFAKQFPALGMIAPLNTEAGQNFVLALIDALGGVDVAIFDNVMSLVAGDQREEIPWNETLPLVAKLSARRIGQIWLDHTGHNTDRQYGSSTKAWRFDAVGVMTPLPGDQRGQDEIAFTLSFEHPGKARRRTPDNREDFETVTVRLKDDRWTSEVAEPATTTRRLTPLGKQFYRAFLDALAVSDTPGCTTRANWFAEAARTGLAEPIMPEDDSRTRDTKQSKFRKYLTEIKVAGLIGVDGHVVTDLRRKP